MYGVFFFKQKTAYEMRISDWSSDVCSSDLKQRSRRGRVGAIAAAENLAGINLFVGLAEAYSAAARRRSGRGATRSGMQSVKGSSPCIGAAALPVAVVLVAGSGAAAAHPHVWIDARLAVIFDGQRSEEETSELQPLMRISSAV